MAIKLRRNTFNFNHEHLLTARAGKVIPVMCQEVHPGDVFQGSTSALIRLNPMARPVMHSLSYYFHTYFVPLRTIWEDYEKFMTKGKTGEERPIIPKISSGDDGFAVGSLADYMGLPTDVPDLEVSAFPFRAYAKIWNYDFRDFDLQDEVIFSIASGPDTTTSTALLDACWGKDRFTRARPWTQRGNDVMLPLGLSAPVVGEGSFDLSHTHGFLHESTSGAPRNLSFTGSGGSGAGKSPQYTGNSNDKANGSITNATTPLSLSAADVADALHVDLAEATGIDIRDLRLGLALQRAKERSARFGNRLRDYLLRSFNVVSSDARIDEPEYLGGGKNVIQMSEVLQTAEGTDPVGNLRGHGIGAGGSNRYRRRFEEHGYVITLMVIRPKTMYIQGLHKMWTREVQEDYLQPEYQHIGDQPILNKEVYAEHSKPDDVFGFEPRYEELRSPVNYVSAQMRTVDADWHMARIFADDVALNGDFVKCNPTERVFMDTNVDPYVIRCFNNLRIHRYLDRNAMGKTY